MIEVGEKPPDLDALTRLVGELKNKRPEECLKFIFSRTFKALMKRFSVDCKKKAEAERRFYNFYFEEVATEQGIGVNAFRNPISVKNGSNQTNFNMKYFSTVFKSRKFTTDFLDYVRKSLRAEYKEEIRKKLEILLRKWERPDPATIDIGDASEYLLKNKKCKLPWTVEEVNNSISGCLTMINEVSPDANIDCSNFLL